MKMHVAVIALTAAALAGCSSIPGMSKFGKKEDDRLGTSVAQERGKTFQVGIRLVEESPQVAAELKAREGKTFPMSALYQVSLKGKRGDPGFTFVDCLKVDLLVTGIANAKKYEGATLDIVSAHDTWLGSIKPTAVGKDSVAFHDVTVRQGAMGIMLPYTFDEKVEKRPKVVLKPKNFTFTGPNAYKQGDTLEYGIWHRTFVNPGDRQVNTGVLVGGTVPKGTKKCS